MIDLNLTPCAGALRAGPTPLAPTLWARWRTRVALDPECRVDLAARAAWRDPVQFRRERLDAGSRARAVLDDVARRAQWARPAPAGTARGVAMGEAGGAWLAVVAEVGQDAGGHTRVRRFVIAAAGGARAEGDWARHAVLTGVGGVGGNVVPVELEWVPGEPAERDWAAVARTAAEAAVHNAEAALQAAQDRARALAAAD